LNQPKPKKRVWLIAGIIGLLSLGGGSAGLHFIQPQLSPLCLIQKCEQQTKIVKVLVAEFDGPDLKNNRVTDTILQKLQQAAGNSQTLKIVPLKQAISQAEGKDKVRELGKAQNADIVIWGWYAKTQEKATVSVNFEMLSPAKDYLRLGKQTQGDIRTMAVASLERFEMQVNLAQELKYLTLVTLGVSSYAADDWDNAIAQLTTALSEAKPNKSALDPAAIYFHRGNAYNKKGEYDRAIADFNQAIQLNPKDAKAFNNRGNAYDEKGEYNRAIADFNEALKLNPKDAGAFNNRGSSYHKKGEYNRAAADFNEALKLNPKDACAFNNRGIFYYNKEEYNRAIADFDRSIQLNTKDSYAFHNRGNFYNNKGEYNRAIADLDRAIQLNPKDADAFYSRGLAYNNKGEYDSAIADFNQAILLNPKDADAFYSRGLAYNKKGEYDRAIADYNQAILLNPKDAAAFYNRGLTYERKGDKIKAIESYRQALALAQNPQVKELAQRNLKELEAK
jgi:tetratricopeptide (TPR) repeat protein